MSAILELYLPEDFDKRFEKYKATFTDENKVKIKNSTDYILEAIDFFKNEYNRVKLLGLTYEYCLAEVFATNNATIYSEEYEDRLKAIERLKEAGLIKTWEIATLSNDNGIWLYAMCKIDEAKITQPKTPHVSEEKVEDLIEKISINEKTSELNPTKFWINKKGQEIWVNDKYYITKPNYHDDNERFFDYAFEKAKPTTEFTKEELENETKRTFIKSFTKLVNGLKFTGQIRKAFFPKVSGKNAVEFRKEVEAKELENEGINIELLVKELEVAHGRSKK